MSDVQASRSFHPRFFVRPLVYSDIPQVFEILQQLSPYVPNTFSYNDFLNFLQQNLCARVAVCSISRDVVGYGSVVFSRKVRLGLQASIEDLAIEPSHQRAGIGTILLNELISLARSKGAYKVILSCKAGNVCFYSKHRFENCEISMKLLF